MALLHVVANARLNPFTTKSQMAREYANEIAILASLGYISTEFMEGSYGNIWLATANGLAWLEVMEDFVKDVLID